MFTKLFKSRKSDGDKEVKQEATKLNVASFTDKKPTKIEILGTGCAKCKTLEKIVNDVVATLDGQFEVVKVDDIQEIMAYNVMSTPGLVIDGEVVSTGKVPSAHEIKELLQKK
jgi:small redox-active disulfide protein 2